MNVTSVLSNHITNYPTSKYINYNWGFGSALGLIFSLQIVSGVLLAFYYKAAEATAFADIIFIINDVDGGFLFKYLHLNGATAIFLLLYLHLFRAIYYRSYAYLPKVWLTGVVLFILTIITAFLGYVLPWGQMSFWAATVITNLITSLPIVGQKLIIYVHGAFSVGGATLSRFFVLHFLLALVVLIVIILHLAFLHSSGSTNPVVSQFTSMPKIQFYYYFLYKDLFFFLVTCFFLSIIVFLYPNVFNHPDNFIEANPLTTPAHIVPEWYFLPFYAILRAVPNKLLGVIAMAASLIVLFILPLAAKRWALSKNNYDAALNLFFFTLLFCFLSLGYLGSMPAEEPYVALSRGFTALYFLSFFSVFWAEFVSSGLASLKGIFRVESEQEEENF